MVIAVLWMEVGMGRTGDARNATKKQAFFALITGTSLLGRRKILRLHCLMME